jgi:signal transduction histidine kinase
MWTLDTQLSLVAILVAVATTTALLLRSRRSLYVRFASFAGSVAAYYLGTLLVTVFGVTTLLASARIIAGGLVVATATLFFDATLGEAGLGARARRRKTFIGAAAIILAGLVPPLAKLEWAQWTCAVSILLLLGWRAYAMIMRANEVESAAERARLRYVAWGGVLALVGVCFDFGAYVGLGVPAISGLVVAIYLYFISQALLRSRLLDLHELLGKALVFGTLALILALVYGVLLVWVGERRGLFLFNTLVASSLILILFEPLKTYLEETTTRVFFREHVDFARAMRGLAKRIATIIEVPVAADVVLDRIYDAKRATHCSLYFIDPDRLAFQLQGFRGPKPAPTVDAKNHPAIFVRAQRLQTPLLRESVRRERLAAAAAEGTATAEAQLRGLDALRADLVIPLRGERDVVGMLCLQDERLSDAYASDEIAALLQVGEQLATQMENSRHFDVLKERDRLASLGEMSAGLAHEIRNPLASIKAAAQELDPAHGEEIDKELLEIIASEVNRLNTVVSQFLDYARPFRGTFTALNANDCVRRATSLLQRDLGEKVEIEIDLAEELPDVNGDAEQLQQVLINLILNAADAIQREGKIEISTRLSDRPGDSGLRPLAGTEPSSAVEIRVRDYGPGIPDGIQRNLFIPFFTTKGHGTGLGLALCQRIVQHHGGSVEVVSVEGRGATFVIRLPAILRRAKPAEAEVDPDPSLDLPLVQAS